MPKKENNKKSYVAREEWMTCKKIGRPKQEWDTENKRWVIKVG